MKTRLVLFSLFSTWIGLAGCDGCEKKPGTANVADAASASSSAAASLPAAPEGLLADVVVTTPNAAWHKLQTGIGGALGILPSTLPGLFITFAQLDPLLADQIDGTAPIHGVLAGDPVAPAYAFAMKLYDPRKAKAFLVDGDKARFTAHEEGGLTEMVPRANAKDFKTAIALTDNSYLLVGHSAEGLRKLAGYVSRTLPARPVPTDAAAVIDIPRSSIATVLRPRLESGWKELSTMLLTADELMQAEKGRAPDFGDPKAIVAGLDAIVKSKLEVFSDVEKMRVAIDVQNEAVGVTMDLTPRAVPGRARAWAETMKMGDASPMLAMPLASALAVVTYDAETDRTAQHEAIEKFVLSSVAGRMDEANKKRFHGVIEDLGKARGDVLSGALVADEPQGLFFRLPVRDEAAAGRTMKGMTDLVNVAPFKEMLRAQGVVTSSDTNGTTVILAREKKKGEEKPSPLGWSWKTSGGALEGAAGGEPAVVMRLGSNPEKKLSEEMLVKKFASDVGATASTLLAVQPLRLDPKRANLPPSPLLISVGKKEKDPVVRALVSDALLREFSRAQMGF